MELVKAVFVNLFTLQNMLFSIFGVLLGIIIGAIPGLTVTLGIILLLPMTYGMDPTTAIVALLAIYVGGCYGGSISAILINTPGTNSALATTLDGYPMTKAGRANKALSASLWASFMGGLLSALLLLFLAPQFAKLAMKFRSPEYFSLAIFGLTVIAGVSSKNVWKGIASACCGIFISIIGLDSLTGNLRYTFHKRFLFGGIGMLPALIGLVALAQVVIKSVELKTVGENLDDAKKKKIEDKPITAAERRSMWKPIIVSTILGSLIGIMPGAGGDVAQFVCYNECKRLSKHPEEFGHGSLEGMAAAESSNNAVVGSAMIPLLTLGIPGDGVTAILLGAFILHGMQPGPKLFIDQAVPTYSIIIGLIVCNLFMYPLGKFFTKGIAKIVNIPYRILGPAITLFCFAGAYANANSIYEMILIVPIAFFGYYLQKLGFEPIPMMLGLILGNLVENNFKRSMTAYFDDLLIFFKEPISLIILIIAFVGTVLMVRMNKKIAEKGIDQTAETTAETN